MTHYRTILFDADDTLFDYVKSESEALARTFEHAGIANTEQMFESYRLINKQLWRDLEQGLIHIGELRTERFRRLLEAESLVIPFNADDLSNLYVKHLGEGSFLLNGAVEICEYLDSQGLHMSIVTNGIREVQLNRIGKSELRNSFKHIIVSEDTGSQKPHTPFFDYAFRQIGLTEGDKQHVLIVGDSLTSDIQGGINYGIDTCWFNPHHLPNTTGVTPKYEIHDLSELKDLLKNGN